MQVEADKQKQYNLGVLKRRDAAISEVVGTAGHVVMYNFNEEKQCWDRKQVEGTLFVVKRVVAPYYQFVVLNRLSSENLVENVNEDFQMELTEQFLLYRNATQEINGIWFYDSAERSDMADLLQRLSTSGADSVAAPPAADSSSSMAQPTATTTTEPTEAAVAAASEVSEEPAVATSPGGTSSNVAQFFNMMQSQMPTTQDVPPMPAAPVNTEPAEPAEPAPPKAEPPTKPPPPPDASAPPSAAPSQPPADVEKLKAHLRTQLEGLLQDDNFMNLLTLEYLRQRKAASQQQKSRPSPPQPPAQPPMPSQQVPAHLLSLLQQSQQ